MSQFGGFKEIHNNISERSNYLKMFYIFEIGF
jgi:hypothetical protein